MGNIRKLLAGMHVEPRTLTANQIWADLCENIHLHYRNARFDFTMMEWATFRAAINHLGKAVEYCIEKYNFKEGDPNFLVQASFNTVLPSNSEYYTNRVTIEFQRDNTVHFHYRDIRLHWTLQEFKAIAESFTDALQKLKETEEFPYKVNHEPRCFRVPIDSIQPYDAGHLPLAEDQEHRDGIEYVKTLIKEGKTIRPILVAPDGQRLDGFKRYMAFKELGWDSIDCIVDPYGQMGGQHNQSLTLDEGEVNENTGQVEALRQSVRLSAGPQL